jgi:hypothetical protein
MNKAYEVRGLFDIDCWSVWSNLTHRFVSPILSQKEAQIQCDKMNDDHYIDQMEQNASIGRL